MPRRSLRGRRRLPVVAGLALAAVVLSAAPAAADPAGPTDYRTEIVDVEPPAPGVELRVIGGDSFIELSAAPGVDVLVIGYRGEDYLRFDADGTVWQNENSPTRWLNDDRFGDVDVPAEATPDAEALWVQVADDGTYAWHDHRSHWMNEARPPASAPGDVILEAVIPMVVSGTPTGVEVRSMWIAGPSLVLPVLLGVAAAAIVALTAWRFDLVVAGAIAVAMAGGVGLVLGAIAYGSVPPETGPSPLLWMLPLAAVVLGGAAVGLRRRGFVASSSAAAAALLLGVWGWLRREAVVRAIIPSDAPAGLDRIAIAIAVAVGGVALVAAVWAAATPGEPAPTPVRSR